MASPSLSRAERYLNCSAEKEKKMTAEDIDEENSDCPSIKNPNHLDSNLDASGSSVAHPFICAAGHLCECKGDPHDDDCSVCLNCNHLAHERCIEPLLISSSNLPFAFSVDDLDHVARSRFDLMSPDEKTKSSHAFFAIDVLRCLMCMAYLRTLHQLQQVAPLAIQ